MFLAGVMSERHHTLRKFGKVLKIIAWVLTVAGFVSTILLAVSASALMPRIYLFLGGLIFTALQAILLFTAAGLIELFVEMSETLQEIKQNLQKSGGE
jgi:hypothetical protein